MKSVITAAVRAPSPTLAPVSAPVSGSDVQSLSRQGSTAGASEIVPIMAFDLAISETALRFANGNRYAYRPGNVSCYPAAMALTPSGKSSFTAVLDECPFANNTMSFGIAVKGFPKSGQQAFGERADSWGIYNNRSENSVEEPSKICASGALVSKFRRLRQGDILRLVCDMNNRTVELSVNGPEFRQIFSLPPDKEFVYGATFCNHHALTLIDGGSARAESADTANPGLQTPEYMAIPFGVYVEQTIPFIAMPTTSTSNISALQSDDALEDAVKERLHVLRRYCKDSERALKELKLVVVPPNKQIKMMNCSMQTSLLPAELQSLSCLLTSLHLLQCDPYPSFRNRASVPNWRELIPGHVIYKHVLPNCMAWASASVHLPLLGPSLRALHNIKVEGAVGYAIQWLQPPHIPATHKLKIVASVYSYMPSAVKARLNGRKLAARAGGVTAVFNEEDGELDKQFLRKVVLCELFGGSEGPVTVSNLGQKKQSIASCNGILSVAAANLFSSAPNFVPTDTRINFPFSVGDSVVVGEEVLEGKYRPAVGEIGDVMSIQKPTDSTAQPKLYEVHVLWRDSPHREMYLVPERLPTGPVSNDVATSNAEKSDVSDISTGPLPEIKIWRKNPMANISGSLEHASKMFPLGSELAPRYLWTPVLTKEIDFILEPIIDSSMMPTSKKSARVDEPLAPDFEAVGLVSLLVTPILSPSAVVHSKTYRELLRHIVDHFAALGSGYQRDAVDGSLVRLLERVLKQKGQNNDRNVPDTLFKLGPSTEDVVHFPHLVLALNREAEWNVRLRDIVYGSVDSTNSVEPDPPSLLIGQSELFSHRFALIRLLNQEMQGCLELINLNIVSKASSRNKSTAALLNLADLLSRCRHYLFSWVKESFVQKAITSSGVDSNSPGKFELVISRSRAVKFASSGEIDSNGRWSVFGQVFRRVHGMPASVLRRSGQLWETVFAGERSHDSGGPYREAWSAIIVDLMSPFLPLLKPCPNNEGKVGMNQETFLINPDCVFNNTQMEMLVFFGKLMGSAARSTNFLDLYLSPLVWKLLVRQPLTLDDIRDIDITAYNQLTTYRQRKGNASSEDTFLAHELHFCTTSKGGSLVELHSGGSTVSAFIFCKDYVFYFFFHHCIYFFRSLFDGVRI